MINKVVLIFILSLASHSTELKFCYEAEAMYPYTNHADAKVKRGIFVDIIEAVSKELNLKLKIYRSSWTRCKEDLRSGSADVITAVIWTKERDKWAVFPKVGDLPDGGRNLWQGIYKVHKKRGSNLGWDGKSFNKKSVKIGAPTGYVAYKKLKKMNALTSNNLKVAQGLKLVSKSRIDGYVVDEVIGKSILKEQNIEDQIETIARPFMTSNWYAPLSLKFYRSNPELAEKFFNSVSRYRKENEKKLIQKYLGNQK
jgi:polar amino acid transport system substrate-binding protein